MAIAFFNPISEDFYNKFCNSSDLDELIDVCVDNVHEFFSVIQTFHGICNCNLENCQIRLFFEGLENCTKNLRRSSCFLRKKFVSLCEKYSFGFRDYVYNIEKRYIFMLPRSHNIK